MTGNAIVSKFQIQNDMQKEMNHVLLLGAGFSRNWHGLLASEVFDELLSNELLDDGIRNVLYENRKEGGFEYALSQLQDEASKGRYVNSVERLTKLQTAISQIFDEMNSAFAKIIKFEWSQDRQYQVGQFLQRFDAIFTLNQDLLLERHYTRDSNPKWQGWHLPGLVPSRGRGMHEPADTIWVPTEKSNFTIHRKSQPIFKLHGSSGWLDAKDQKLLVMGGSKKTTIGQHELLKWYAEQFVTYLGRANTRLMTIGYGFGDDHINDSIANATGIEGFGIFVVDPAGIDVMNRIGDAQIPYETDFFQLMKPHVRGISNRSLTETFGGDVVEHPRIMKFFT